MESIEIKYTTDVDFSKLYNWTSNDYLEIEGISRHKLDIMRNIKSYQLNGASSTIDQNASAVSFSPNNYINTITAPSIKLANMDMLSRQINKCGFNGIDAIKKHIHGDLYIHDLIHIHVPYCVGFSTNNLRIDGMKWGQLHSNPAKRAKTFIGQAIETIHVIQGQFAGAVAPSDILLMYASYGEKDEKVIENDMQSFCHGVNNTLRVSNQSPFTNVSLMDTYISEKMIEDSGVEVDFDLYMKTQEIFANFMAKGSDGIPYRFPIVTVNLTTNDENRVIDDKFYEDMMYINAKYNLLPFTFYAGSEGKFSSCCRLLSSVEKMREMMSNSFGRGGVNIGSLRVVTINLPRIAYKAKNKNHFFEILHENLITTIEILYAHRELIRSNIEKNFLMFFKPLNWLDISFFFSTIGWTGLWESSLVSTGKIDINFMREIVEYIEKYAEAESTRLGFPINVECVPGESACSKLLQKDKIRYKQARMFNDVYSNQIVPLNEDMSLIDRLKITSVIQPIISGGAMLHINMQENPEADGLVSFGKNIISSGINQFAFNKIFTRCNRCGFVSTTANESCSKCGSDDIVNITRIVGYFVPVPQFSKERRKELESRIIY